MKHKRLQFILSHWMNITYTITYNITYTITYTITYITGDGHGTLVSIVDMSYVTSGEASVSAPASIRLFRNIFANLFNRLTLTAFTS